MNDTLNQQSPVIGVYDARSQAEAAIKSLHRGGFDMSKVSIVGKGVHGDEEAHGFYTVGDRVRAWGASGGFWGAAWGLLLGSAVFSAGRAAARPASRRPVRSRCAQRSSCCARAR